MYFQTIILGNIRKEMQKWINIGRLKFYVTVIPNVLIQILICRQNSCIAFENKAKPGSGGGGRIFLYI